MTPAVQDKWGRAKDSLRAARHLLTVSPDSAASRAYYAAFHAVSALFLHEGTQFKKHTGVETAVHRDLVKSGRWASALGKAFNKLRTYRTISDYSSSVHVSPQEAQLAVELAEAVLTAVAKEYPDLFLLKD